uniref:Uncharacterized protein n=1 Tax=Oryza brachyantha TaxID=4533 RepID=J3N1Y5_ORYBR
NLLNSCQTLLYINRDTPLVCLLAKVASGMASSHAGYIYMHQTGTDRLMYRCNNTYRACSN